ncbi:hypothetical protein EKO23_21850 [Nocardioides guangzhouensis]|uniref:DUF222 domain-containing protein n=1 Tax=Nocardioides guangzhouensis TaxID=2497878 RepID=A0A4Q4Z5T1_9ACTN|nr:hypothetical protein [Nocardioides guangzhouensis]RYP82376.1 hypothetical protein EKO23_21850 [Nocardioides guangzhouensis]
MAAFAAEPFGAALGVSTRSAMGLLADALDLRHRFPLLWAKVEALAVAPWKARRVATDTRSLPLEAARWVDTELAQRVDGFGLPTIERLVAHAAARFAPAKQTKESAGREGWHVTFTHPAPGEFAGTSWLEAAGPTPDLTAFHDLVGAEATALGRLGDTGSYGQRQAKALGVIAARQATLDLTGHEPQQVPRPEGDHPASARPHPRRRRRHPRPTYLDARDGDPPRPALRVPVVRPRRPVLRPRPHRPLRRHRTTRPDPAGPSRRALPTAPPGQDLRRLDPHRLPDGSYRWTSLHGATYTVGPQGTHATGPSGRAASVVQERAPASTSTPALRALAITS